MPPFPYSLLNMRRSKKEFQRSSGIRFFFCLRLCLGVHLRVRPACEGLEVQERADDGAVRQRRVAEAQGDVVLRDDTAHLLVNGLNGPGRETFATPSR